MTAGSNDSEGPAIDPGILDSLARDAGPEAMPALIASFVRDCAKREAEIVAAADRADLVALEAQSHALTSSAQTFGALTLAGLSQEIEAECRAGRTEAALSRAARLPDRASAARREMAIQAKRFEDDGTAA